MKLQDCDQKADLVSLSPIVRNEPEPRWKISKDKGIAPASLYDFYVKCGYFSFGSSPSLLRHDSHLLFTLVEELCVGMSSNFGEAIESIEVIDEAAKKSYNPIKKWRREKYEYDQKSQSKQSKAFKDLVISLTGILDQFTEIVAVIFNNQIPGSDAGRSQFIRFYNEFLKGSCPIPTGTIVDPASHFKEALHKQISPIVVCAGDEEDWLEVLYLYRNKLAHLGIGMFMQMAFADHAGDQFYSFMPKKWPYHIQAGIKNTKASPAQAPKTVMETWGDILSHCDIVEFSSGALGKVQRLVQEGMLVVTAAFVQMKDLPFNQAAFDSVTRNTKTYKFKSFK